MNEQQVLEVTETKVQPSLGPGASLRIMREARNISLEDMSKQLRLSLNRLSQIENDDYKNIGAGAYAIGYLRSYARALGLAETDILEILKSFETSGFGTEINTNRPQLINEKITNSNPKFARRVSYLLLMVAVILVGFWWYSNHTNPATVMPVNDNALNSASALPVLPVMPNVTPENNSIQAQTSKPSALIDNSPKKKLAQEVSPVNPEEE